MKWDECKHPVVHDYDAQHNIRINLSKYDSRLNSMKKGTLNERFMIDDEVGMLTSQNVMYMNVQEDSPFQQIYDNTIQAL
mmetsp:Transcript_30838/g.30342  ORF Transcript_30838/g.30342 Transcript_30838/m.30342 type:complete len:80 (-) Transcript_30838:516-755(-)